MNEKKTIATSVIRANKNYPRKYCEHFFRDNEMVTNRQYRGSQLNEIFHGIAATTSFRSAQSFPADSYSLYESHGPFIEALPLILRFSTTDFVFSHIVFFSILYPPQPPQPRVFYSVACAYATNGMSLCDGQQENGKSRNCCE